MCEKSDQALLRMKKHADKTRSSFARMLKLKAPSVIDRLAGPASLLNKCFYRCYLNPKSLRALTNPNLLMRQGNFAIRLLESADVDLATI